MIANMAKIEIYRGGCWTSAADILELGVDRCVVDYLPEYIFGNDAVPISFGMPLEFRAERMSTPDGGGLEEPDRRPPPFLYDLVPQGRGRKFLLGLLRLADSDNLILPLLLNGAFNPIGNLRIDTAVEFYERRRADDGSPDLEPLRAPGAGFSIDDIAQRSEAFLSHLEVHSMLASGTTGVQGVAPKFLLTQDADGRWFSDLALPDDRAFAHWLVKLPRGRSDDDRAVLRNEAGYLRTARACGVRLENEPMLVGEMLFVRRFDRVVQNGTLHRLHQESLASVAGLRGFGPAVDQNTLLSALRAYVSNPLAETIEYLKRDVLNMALRNTDNHARNTALQRLPDGTVQLTPLYDFAPMFMDPEVVPRTVHWRVQGRSTTDWVEILHSLEIPDNEREPVFSAMKAFAAQVSALPEIAKDCGIEPDVLEKCRASIDRVANDLSRIDVVAQRIEEDSGHAKTKTDRPRIA